MFYYHSPSKLLVETDSLDVGNSESESGHKYRIEGTQGITRFQKDTASYEGFFDGEFSDDGRWTDRETSFTVKIDPKNDGVRIRKRINQTAYHQEIDVYVDGALAGCWFEQGANYVLNYDHQGYRDMLEGKYAKLGKPVPTWQNGAIPAKFRDTEFEIPASMTKGKKKISLRMVARNSLAVNASDAGLVNEYYYWICSYRKLESAPRQ